MEISAYEQQANDFLAKTGTEFKVEFIKNDYHFDDDKDKRDIYKITFKRGKRQFSFNFGQSLVKSQHYVQTMSDGSIRKFTITGNRLEGNYKITDMSNYLNAYSSYDRLKPQLTKGETPTSYDVLTCLQKYDVGSFEDFCSDFGYDEDSRKAEKIYKAVCKEYENICKLWSDEEIEELQEIQ
jgi:hypothetical protein